MHLPSTLTRRTGAIGLLGAAALAIAGCGSAAHHSTSASAGSSGVGGAVIAKAADISGAAKGERVAYTLTESLPSVGTVQVAGTGAFNAKPAEGQLNLTVAAPNASGLGLAGTLLAHLPLSLVLANKTVYLKIPSSVQSLVGSFTHNKSWISINLADLAGASKIPGLSSVLNGQTNPTDPAAELKQFEAAATNGVTKVGSATVNGVATTEYSGTLDLAKLSQRLPAALRSAMSHQLARAAKAIGSTKLPFTVYIDSANLIRRLDLSFSGSHAGSAVKATMQMDFLAYGPQPAPTIPPAADTFGINGLLGSLKSLAASAGAGLGG
ncbi:hypothetical protein [Conexibacter sp. DBS9H8]|uniref:hypothetical protein n=1 Tax=Conexibacter sp. DBS9H8 TaxID=2937801 RepID=UPI00200CC272|nr:hypothetical protein [Conexibacter sp. DBS9H8]